MKLENTKQYYRDLAHFYFMKQRMELMSFFLGLVNGASFSYSEEDTNDWFAKWQITRPERDEEGSYI